MPSSRKRLAAALGLGVAVSGLSLVAAPAQAVSTGIVISEVYGAGGNAGASYNADFVELRNLGSAPASLDGMAIQYRSGGGSPGAVPFALSGSVPAEGRFLIQMSATGANGTALPTPDAVASPAFAMSGSAGQVVLTNTTAPFTGTGNVAGNAALVDMVGYGTAPNTYEGAPTGADLTATTSAQRAEPAADTDHNANDFSEAAPTPDAAPGGGGGGPVELSIAEIQGAGDASEEVGNTVITEGVVTARYPTGGYTGFYIQTGGTGGATDATPGASDGIFVYGPEAPCGPVPRTRHLGRGHRWGQRVLRDDRDHHRGRGHRRDRRPASRHASRHGLGQPRRGRGEGGSRG